MISLFHFLEINILRHVFGANVIFWKAKLCFFRTHLKQLIKYHGKSRKNKSAVNAILLWKIFQTICGLVYFDQKYTYSTTSGILINPVKTINRHGNDQSVSRSGAVLGVLCGGNGFVWVWIFIQRFENQHIMTKRVIKTLETTQMCKFPGLLLKQYCFELCFFIYEHSWKCKAQRSDG